MRTGPAVKLIVVTGPRDDIDHWIGHAVTKRTTVYAFSWLSHATSSASSVVGYAYA